MALMIPNLDDRTAQQLVDQAKRMIPRFCPEWTDHNVSDPGVTLIELFAWMTELLLYRVNQVPDAMYIRFLELLGMSLKPPRAAETSLLFSLSAPLSVVPPAPRPDRVVIPADTEVATVRTETAPAIIFTTEEQRIIYPPQLMGAFTRASRQSRGDSWLKHDLAVLRQPERYISIFPETPEVGDALYFAFNDNHRYHVLALVVDCERAAGGDIDFTNPPIEWHVSYDGAGSWAVCSVIHDDTGGFNQSGEIVLQLPEMAAATYQGVQAFWLRCRLRETNEDNMYRVSPKLHSIEVQARGGIVNARNAIAVTREVLGTSDGTSGQTFWLSHTPILSLNAASDYLEVQAEPPDGPWETWQCVPHFARSEPDDPHFTLDHQDGTLALGLRLVQPNGELYSFGRIPESGSVLRFSRYQYGGGVTGNVLAEKLSVLKTSIPRISRVVNPEAASGGLNAQSLEDAKLRVPQVFGTRDRAVTATDFVWLACEAADVARAWCLAPDNQTNLFNTVSPGWIEVVIVPRIAKTSGYLSPGELKPSAALIDTVTNYLEARKLVGTNLVVRSPRFVWVAVHAYVRVGLQGLGLTAFDVQRKAEAELYRYLNPYTGGPLGDGWPFGRQLYHSEIFSVLQSVPGLEFVEDVRLNTVEDTRLNIGNLDQSDLRPAPSPLVIDPDTLICSFHHTVEIVM